MIEFNKTYELLGFIQGDGVLTDLNNPDKKGMAINIGKDDMDIKDYFNLPLAFGERIIYYQNGDLINLIRKLKFSLNPLPNRDLPESFSRWTDIEKISFIKGLYSANGSILKNYGRITLKTTNKKLAEDVKSYWISIGLNPYITTNKSKDVEFSNGIYTCKESYDLNLGRKNEVEWFGNNVGFIQVYKNKRIQEFLNKPNKHINN